MTRIDVDIWIFSLTVAPNVVGPLSAILAPDELARAERFLVDANRTGYVVGRGRLRQILAQYLSLPARELRFAYGDAGKPCLVESLPRPLHFNLSHSGGLAALAVCTECPVGVDIEEIRTITDKLAERYFSAVEVGAIAALPPEQQTVGFFRCWTRKEAVVKAVGGGLNIPLKSFVVSVEDESHPELMRADASSPIAQSRWKLFDFSPASGFAGAVAVMTDLANGAMEVDFHLRRYAEGESAEEPT